MDLKRPITIQMPVNLRREGDKTAGNKTGIVQVELSTPTDDPYIRLRNIGYSLRNVRTMIDSVPLVGDRVVHHPHRAGGARCGETTLSDALPLMSNAMVSNVPAPQVFLHIKGARMEEMHPISVLPPSNRLNITLFSYAGTLYFGLVADDRLPELKRLGDLGEA